MKAWDVQEEIRKSLARHGSGPAPLVFTDNDGNSYDFIDVNASKDQVTVVIKRIEPNKEHGTEVD